VSWRLIGSDTGPGPPPRQPISQIDQERSDFLLRRDPPRIRINVCRGDVSCLTISRSSLAIMLSETAFISIREQGNRAITVPADRFGNEVTPTINAEAEDIAW
jgi:hypothetical protein